jgi:hypothetical protein
VFYFSPQKFSIFFFSSFSSLLFFPSFSFSVLLLHRNELAPSRRDRAPASPPWRPTFLLRPHGQQRALKCSTPLPFPCSLASSHGRPWSLSSAMAALPWRASIKLIFLHATAKMDAHNLPLALLGLNFI